MEQWFQNTRGLVIIVLAVITGAVLLAIEPGDGFPTGASGASGGDTTVTTTVTTVPQSVDHHHGGGGRRIQEGTPDTGQTTVLQSNLARLGYNVGTPDGSLRTRDHDRGHAVPDRQQAPGRRRRRRGHVERAPGEPGHHGHDDHHRALDATTAPVGTSAGFVDGVGRASRATRRSVS